MNSGYSNPDPTIPSETRAPKGSVGTTVPSYSPRKLRAAVAERFVKDATGGVAGHPVAGVVALVLFMDLVGIRDSLIWFGFLILCTGLRVIIGVRARKLADQPLEARKHGILGCHGGRLRMGRRGASLRASAPQRKVAVLLVIMAGLVAVATTTLVADNASFYGFSTILLGSVFISAAIRGAGLLNPLDPNLSFGLLALVLTFWVVMSVLQRKANNNWRIPSRSGWSCGPPKGSTRAWWSRPVTWFGRWTTKAAGYS